DLRAPAHSSVALPPRCTISEWAIFPPPAFKFFRKRNTGGNQRNR
ncbi:hypothetical protein V3C99_018323, partial [Haemonchus contortus]